MIYKGTILVNKSLRGAFLNNPVDELLFIHDSKVFDIMKEKYHDMQDMSVRDVVIDIVSKDYSIVKEAVEKSLTLVSDREIEKDSNGILVYDKGMKRVFGGEKRLIVGLEKIVDESDLFDTISLNAKEDYFIAFNAITETKI